VVALSGEALKEEIRKGAQDKAALVLTEARTKAEEIMAEAESESKRLLEARLQDAQRRLEQVERSEAAKARMECTRKILGLQSRYVEEAFSEAESRLNSLPTRDPAQYRSVLARLIAEASGELAGARLVAIVRESDRKLAEDIVRVIGDETDASGGKPRISVSGEPLGSSGGVILRTEDEKGYFVNTLESRLLRARDELRANVTDTLLGRG
jgi:vacuolar-type H+-ATPase subunit E/Vma4